MDEMLDPKDQPLETVPATREMTAQEVLESLPVEDGTLMAIKEILTQVDGNIAVSSTGQNLNIVGQILRVVEINNQLQDALRRKNNELVLVQAQTGSAPLITAKGLLVESMKWLSSFEGTRDLRQRIKMFMERL